MDDLKKIADDLRSHFEDFKSVNEEREAEIKKLGDVSSETQAKLDKIQEQMTEIEGRFEKASLDTDRRRGEELTEERKAWLHFLATGKAAEPTEEQKAMISGSEADGGVFVPVEMDAELLKGITEFSPVRRIVNVKTTRSQSRKFRKRTSQAGAAVWTGEAETRSDTGGPAYGIEEIPTHELYAEHAISRWELQDATRDMEAELMAEWAEQFALAEGTAVVSGNGFKKPEGIVTNADVEVVTAADQATFLVGADDIFEVKYALKEGYLMSASLRFLFNRSTLKKIRLLKDANDQYLWQPSMALDAPATLDGTPYVLVPDMADDGTDGNKPIAVGDFRRGYTLLDRQGTLTQRDPYSQSSNGLVQFSAFRRLGGQVLVPEAIKVLQVSS